MGLSQIEIQKRRLREGFLSSFRQSLPSSSPFAAGGSPLSIFQVLQTQYEDFFSVFPSCPPLENGKEFSLSLEGGNRPFPRPEGGEGEEEG